jgi:nucleoside diphosphate kinase
MWNLFASIDSDFGILKEKKIQKFYTMKKEREFSFPLLIFVTDLGHILVDNMVKKQKCEVK